MSDEETAGSRRCGGEEESRDRKHKAGGVAYWKGPLVEEGL